MKSNEKVPLRVKKSKAYQELLKLAQDNDNEVNENNNNNIETNYLITDIKFDENLRKTLKGILKNIIKYSIPFIIVELTLFIIFGLWSAIIGLFFGTIGSLLGLLFIAKSYENYDIITLGSFKIPKMYGLRYIFYASLFLLSTLITKEPMWGIIGTFIGMINLKMVIYLFSWRW
ncbi:hypothetical protein Fnod_0332 [Fervidobacterium nodosum Rt17-B1]|uniref:Uncharacterized protein n=2 Tax=Fervidobacteriaceae TaxID=1643950 RepID=A7HJW4_FERNB|nr:hypothetical protein Fnod_0332 [Fervidobacterium nodosum Rt17-B1]